MHFYNRRQDIEAGIKEFKGVFYLGHMRFFSVQAIQIQEQLITFLPNFIRWAIGYYFRPNAIRLPNRADRGLDQLKDTVRLAMRSQAEVRYKADGCVLQFLPKGTFAGLVIDLRQPSFFQLALPLFSKLSIFESVHKTCPDCTITTLKGNVLCVSMPRHSAVGLHFVSSGLVCAW